LKKQGADQLNQIHDSVKELRSRIMAMEEDRPSSSSSSSTPAAVLDSKSKDMAHIEWTAQEALDLGDELVKDVNQKTELIATLRTNIDHLREEMASLKESGVEKAFPSMIVSEYGVAHQPTVAGLDFSKEKWRTRCGWKFGYSSYEAKESIPRLPRNICEGCFPKEKKAALVGESQEPEGGLSTSESEAE
jgi:hypothetical protein